MYASYDWSIDKWIKYNENKYVSYMFTIINFERCLVHSPPVYGWMTAGMAWKHKLSTNQCALKDETKLTYYRLIMDISYFLECKKKKKNQNKQYK